MSRQAIPLQLARTLRARPMLLWMLAMLVVLKAAVPLLAAASALQRGVTLAEVCSVYGVRIVVIEQGDQGSGAPAHTPSEHAGGDHCALTPLMGGALPATPAVAAVLLHAPAAARTVPLADAPPLRDASRAWLAAHTHAPPPSV